MKNKKSFIALFIGLICTNSFSAAPFCNLRDPSRQIYSMFPDATNFRSIVREVNNNVRSTLSLRIPFQIHANEVGEHTLYIPVKNEIPLGVVHVRSEMTDWGMAEIVWGLDAQLNVSDIRFQRCRGISCKSLLEKGFVTELAGKSTLELSDLLSGGSYTQMSTRLALSEGESRLARALIQSAIKTIAVTEIAWPTTVAEIRVE